MNQRHGAHRGRVATLPKQTHHKPLDERRQMGRALREACPRSSFAEWSPARRRPDPIDLLIESGEGRLESLLPIRYGRMLASPFAFYRGAAVIMASDLARAPRSGLDLQICGDCHLLNFGGFATPERRIVFDLNDFDETSVGPWEWDVLRLAASFVVAGQANGFKPGDCREAALLAARAYREAMREHRAASVMKSWYEAMDFRALLAQARDPEMRRFYERKLAAAAAESAHEKEFAKLAHMAGAPARIVDRPPLIFHYGDLRDEEFRELARGVLVGYRDRLAPDRRVLMERYALADLAIKVVGVGSVGRRCGILLFMSGNDEPLFLQFKEAGPSVVERHVGRSEYSHHGERVVVGQRLMQAASDIFLGWTTGADGKRAFYIRQLADAKVKPVIELMAPLNLKGYAGVCGRALARAHCRSGDAAVLASYLGKSDVFERAVADFGVAYAAQNERDHAALVDAVRSGRLEAQTVE